MDRIVKGRNIAQLNLNLVARICSENKKPTTKTPICMNEKWHLNIVNTKNKIIVIQELQTHLYLYFLIDSFNQYK